MSNTSSRLLAQTCACRPYQDNYDEMMKIQEETGRKPAEILREALDDWLQVRRAGATGASIHPQDEWQESVQTQVENIQRSINQLTDTIDDLINKFDYLKRRDHGYLIEIFKAAYGARDLLWKREMAVMRNGKQTEESIKLKRQALEREWDEEANAFFKWLRETIWKEREDVEDKIKSGWWAIPDLATHRESV